MKKLYIYSIFYLFALSVNAQSNLQIIGTWSLPGLGWPTEVIGDSNYVYMAYDDKVLLFDIHTPENSEIINITSYQHDVQCLQIYDSLAYIINDYQHVCVYEISDPLNWERIKVFKMHNFDAYELEIWGDYAYFACADSGLEVWNIGEEPYFIKKVSSGDGLFYKITRHDKYLYASDWNKYLNIYDLTEPANPELVVSYPCDKIFQDLIYKGGLLFTCADVGSLVYDVNDPANPVLTDTLRAGINFSKVINKENLLILGSSLDRIICLYDISDPTNPQLLSEINGLIPSHLNIYGDLLFIAEFNRGLYIYNISDLTNPILYTRCDTHTWCKKIAKHGDYIYTASEVNGLIIVDCSNPQAPVKVSAMYPGVNVNDVQFFNNTLFMSGSGDKGIMAVNVDDPESPEMLYSIPLSGTVREFAFKDNYLFVPDSGLKIFDMADFYNPSLVAKIDLQMSSGSLVFNENLIILSGINKHYFIDISNPNTPEMISAIYSGWNAPRISVYNNHLYEASNEGGLKVYDITDPVNYIVKGRFLIGEYVNEVQNFNDTLFVTSEGSKIRMYELKNPMQLSSIGSHNNCLAFDYYKEGNLIYVASLSSGITILRYGEPANNDENTDIPTHYNLSQNYPNPFNPVTNISFSLPVKSNVKLTIFNALGQEVKILAAREMEAGVHTLNFDALSIASGIYFYRVTVEGTDGTSYRNTKKMVLQK